MRASIKEVVCDRLARALTDKFVSVVPAPLNPAHWRTVNRFKLGADPEFYFLRQDGRTEAAENLGLRTGLLYGADNNGRLAEVRPAPSRSVLEVIANTRTCLGVLQLAVRETNNLWWRSSAWTGHDGVGGHVHFGTMFRKPQAVVWKLDRLAEALSTLGITDNDKNRLIQRQRQGYGALGDFRAQKWGFEYRTLATWMHGMTHAHLVLTALKLAPYVLDNWWETATHKWDLKETAHADMFLRALFTAFADIDSDVALVLDYIQNYGWPVFKELRDLRPVWGIPGPDAGVQNPAANAPPPLGFIPSAMAKATAEDIAKAISWIRMPNPPVWELPCLESYGYQLPTGFVPLNMWVPHAARWVERIRALCVPKTVGRVSPEALGGEPFWANGTERKRPAGFNLRVSKGLLHGSKREYAERIAKILECPPQAVIVQCTPDTEGLLQVSFHSVESDEQLLEILTAGFLPIFDVRGNVEEAHKRWLGLKSIAGTEKPSKRDKIEKMPTLVGATAPVPPPQVVPIDPARADVRWPDEAFIFERRP